jgi:F-box interacting protein
LCRSSHASPGESLPDDLLVEILSRLPAKSICRSKCVSKRWLGLIHDRSHRKKLAQTLEGFFHGVGEKKPFILGVVSPVHFTDISGSRRPLQDFAFLPNSRRVHLLDCCNGLLLCRWYAISGSDDEFRFVVCNPVTEQWLALPDSGQDGKVGTARLGFDPAVSSHFHVFVLLEEDFDPCCKYFKFNGVHVYSSESERWIRKEKGWDRDITLTSKEKSGSSTVFLNGYLHFCIFEFDRGCENVAAVHTEGETWMILDVPYYVEHGFIQQSQGRLHYVGLQMGHSNQVVVYFLEDYDSKKWVLKHSVHFAHIGLLTLSNFVWIAIHPDCNLIFFTMGHRISLMCYNMDRRKIEVVCELGDGCPPYLPYVPLYAELQALHM